MKFMQIINRIKRFFTFHKTEVKWCLISQALFNYYPKSKNLVDKSSTYLNNKIQSREKFSSMKDLLGRILMTRCSEIIIKN